MKCICNTFAKNLSGQHDFIFCLWTSMWPFLNIFAAWRPSSLCKSWSLLMKSHLISNPLEFFRISRSAWELRTNFIMWQASKTTSLWWWKFARVKNCSFLRKLVNTAVESFEILGPGCLFKKVNFNAVTTIWSYVSYNWVFLLSQIDDRSNDWQNVQYNTDLLKQRHKYLYRMIGIN